MGGREGREDKDFGFFFFFFFFVEILTKHTNKNNRLDIN